MDTSPIRKYVHRLRDELRKVAKPMLGLDFKVYNCGKFGAVISLSFKNNPGFQENYYDGFPSIENVLSQRLPALRFNPIDGPRFKGTNMIMITDEILIIKDTNPYEWSYEKITDDVKTILSPPKANANEVR
ncbi:hypothetical protein SAMN06265348_101587 [Pedobacter westerhofensis]|uniref:Uncharacterized protein n=1 Tax=Pedobacter westerhofensis TaxID=425512 RepID=A0A521B0B4_9SPHI|nr:hypothetical protein [Pedobacter westerhofensis]SMO40548.1 hypothetical protein SAMN06265348_101587 [Pedobacter westerhofensis]